MHRLLAATALVAAGFAGGLVLTASDEQAAEFGVRTALAAPQGDLDPADVAAMTMPAVVNINTDKVVEMQSHPFMDDPFFRRFFDRQMPDRERRERSLGSGVVISADGYIVTNNHIVEDAESIRVTFNDRESYDAEVIGTDPQTDVALIKIDPERDLPHLDFGDNEALRVGERVLAVGNPFGVGQTVTMGIVSAMGRSIGLMDYEDHIQTDASINPGNSGGALVNMRGEVVGINSAILSRSGGSQGIGFAIPASMVQRIIESLREDGQVERAWLGVSIQPVNQSIADYYGLDKPTGVLVARVNEDTPADEAGLEDGDIILSVDGRRVDTTAQLRNTVSLTPVGATVELRLLRDDEEISKKVTLGEMPTPENLAQGRSTGGESVNGLEGVKVRELNEQLRRRFDIDDSVVGLMITDIDPSSKAAREGLREGDVILEIDRKEISSLGDYRDAMKDVGEHGAMLRVLRPQTDQALLFVIPK
jgi:serine protease Do